MAEATRTVAIFDDDVTTWVRGQATRRWLEAELSPLVPAATVDAVTSAVGEFLGAACVPQRPVHVRVEARDDEVVIEVACESAERPELDALAHAVLDGAVDAWGVSAIAPTTRLWARVTTL